MSSIQLNLGAVASLLVVATAAFAQNPTPLVTKTADQLVAVLKSDAGLKEKADACRELAVVGGKEAIPALTALLPDEKLNHMARYALETIADPAVDAALRGQLDKLKGRPLIGVIGSLGVRHDAASVAALGGLLGGTDDEVVQAAALALGTIGTPEAVQALIDNVSQITEKNRVAFCEAFLRGADHLAAEGRKDQALEIFDHYADTDLPHQVRAGALRQAILVRGAEGVALLRQNLHTDDYILFAAAVRTSREMKGPEVTGALTGELKQAAADRQIVLLQALGSRADPTALPAVFELIRNAPPTVRLAAVRMLPMIGDPAAVPVLVELLADADKDVSAVALDALAGFPGAPADAAAIALLGSSQESKQAAGIDLIGRRRLSDQGPALMKVAANGAETLRPAAIQRIGEVGGPGDLPAVLDLLLKAKSQPELDACTRAASLLSAKSSDPTANAGSVSARIREAQPAQKQALVHVLGAIGGPTALKAVSAVVQDDDAQVRSTAIRMLGSWKTADAAPALLDLARNAKDPTDRTVSLQSYLQFIADSDLPPSDRLAMCQQAEALAQRTEEKKALLSALGSIRTVEALSRIAPYLNDAATKDEAGAATVAIATELLKSTEAASVASKLIEPLKKVAEGTDNADLAKRARAQLNRAQEKSK